MAQAAILARTPPQPADAAPHLLLVDDDRRIRDLLSRYLCGEGYRVTTAMRAQDARAKLNGLHFDLLILDVMMPGEPGFELARFIRAKLAAPRSGSSVERLGLCDDADEHPAIAI